MDADALLARLGRLDWFEGYTPAAKTKAEAAIRASLAQIKGSSKAAQAEALAAIRGAKARMTGEGSYTQFIEDVAEHSFGLFTPTIIDEEWSDEEDEVVLTFSCSGRRFRRLLSTEFGEDLDPGVFVLLNEALAAHVPPFCLRSVGDDGAHYAQVLVTPAAHARAVKDGIIPA